MKIILILILISFCYFVIPSYSNVTKSFAYKNIININNLVSKNKRFIYNPSSQESLEEQYLSWAKKLSKEDIIKIIAYEEKGIRGFSSLDAQNLAKNLQKKSFSDLFDTFTMYQNQLLFDKKDTIHFNAQRIEKLHDIYSQEQSDLPLLRKVPLIHNLEKNILPDITTITDQALYTKIEDEMKKMGFSAGQINNEIAVLKRSSVEELEKKIPGLQAELIKRLYYLNKANFQVNSSIVSLDQYVHVFHTWIATAASIASLGVGFSGIGQTFLSYIANSKLFDPSITQSIGYRKQEILSMIYAQYKSCNEFSSIYINPHFKENKLLTKAQTLSQIKNGLEKIGLDQKAIDTQMNKYENSSKEELEVILTEVDYLGNHINSLKISHDEKTIAISTKNDLIKNISRYIDLLDISPAEKDRLIGELRINNVYALRMILHDTAESFKKYSLKNNSTKLLQRTTFKISADKPMQFLYKFRDRILPEQKNELYQHWKAMQAKQQEQTDTVEAINRNYQKASFLHSLIR